MDSTPTYSDVLVIGAGPSGAVASALLRKKGWSVRIIERQHFPRFSIGESLLAHCLDIIEEAGMGPAVFSHGFQFKNGAAFVRGHEHTDFNFGEAFTPGYRYAFQVQRAPFDKILADEAAKAGTEIRYGDEVQQVDFSGDLPKVTVKTEDGRVVELTSRFVLDASGFGRMLPRLLDLETPSHLPSRKAYFTHIEDNISPREFDRQKIRITVHPKHHDIWFWLIPFSNGRSSLGVVALDGFYDAMPSAPEARLKGLIAEDAQLSKLLRNAVYDTPVNELRGYSANVRAMHGRGWALLGNAAEFLDPVFSSGVTIALESASLAAKALDRQLAGGKVDWEADFAVPLKRGVDAFRTYVNSWYDGRFQTVLFHPRPSPEIKAMVCSLLAGYAWDEKNPYVTQSERRLQTLYELIKNDS